MKSPSLDTLHSHLYRSMLLAQSYTEVPGLFFILKGCRLKPYDYIFGHKNEKTLLYRWWFDEFGNSLKIEKNKKIQLIYHDLSLERDKIVCTDLYYGLAIDKVVKMSKLIHLCLGIDEDLHQECSFITFLGLDNYLRSYLYLYGEWQQVSPLLLGMKNLRALGRHADLKYFRQLGKKENMPIPCLSGRVWISCLPTPSNLITELKKHSEKMAFLLENK